MAAPPCTPGIPANMPCPLHSEFAEYCIVKKSEAEAVCWDIPDCKYIATCTDAAWNARNKDSVQLGIDPIRPSSDWSSCEKEPLSKADSGSGSLFILLLAILATAYIAVGVAIGRRSRGKGGRLIEAHPHYARWLGFMGLVVDGVNLVRGGGKLAGGSGTGSRAPLLLLPPPSDAQRSGNNRSSKKAKQAGKKHTTREDSAVTGKTKTKKRKEGGKSSNDGGGGSGGAATAAAGSASSARPTDSAAGGGGRWVHLPS
jgi:hypothetical protein